MAINQGGCLWALFSTHSGKFPHSRREQERAICDTEGETSEPVSYHLCRVVVAFIILEDPVPEGPCEVSIISVQTQLKESLLNVASYRHGVLAKTK